MKLALRPRKPAKNPTKEWSPRSWHRRATKPVIVWMGVFLLAGAVHTTIPEYRWVLIHLFTLGILTNSVMVWSQYLTEKFNQHKLGLETRPAQLRRIYILNVGVIIVIAGQILGEWWDTSFILTQIGATIVAAMLLWHGISLFNQWREIEAAKRFRVIVLGYVASALFLPVGAFIGAILATDLNEPWYSQMLFAHVAANIGGFVGLAAAASLTVLFPSIWRTKAYTHRMSPTLILLSLGTIITVAGAIPGLPVVSAVGLAVYTAGWVLSLHTWLGNVGEVLKQPRDRINFSSASVLAATIWLALTLVYFAVQVLMTGQFHPLPTLQLLIGFAAQLLIGVMSYLLPTTMGGGPAAVRTGLSELNWAGLTRFTLVNGGLIIWLATEKSWLAVVASMLCIFPLAIIPVLIVRSVKKQRAVLLGESEGSPPPDGTTPWGQVTTGLVLLALLMAAFGGI